MNTTKKIYSDNQNLLTNLNEGVSKLFLITYEIFVNFSVIFRIFKYLNEQLRYFLSHEEFII